MILPETYEDKLYESVFGWLPEHRWCIEWWELTREDLGLDDGLRLREMKYSLGWYKPRYPGVTAVGPVTIETLKQDTKK